MQFEDKEKVSEPEGEHFIFAHAKTKVEFAATYSILGILLYVCNIIIDRSSCKNIISTKMINKIKASQNNVI